MKKTLDFLKILADENRLRLVRLLAGHELFVCQLMGVLGLSQPLVSRNLALLERCGLLQQSRRGKQVFYRLRRGLPAWQRQLLAALDRELRDCPCLRRDAESLERLQARMAADGGRCDMATLKHWMKTRREPKEKDKENGSWKT